MKRPLIPALLLVLTACRPAALPVTYHALRAQAPADPAQARDLAVMVGPARFPDLLDRPQVVTGDGEGRVTLSETHRWAGSLEQDFLNVLAEDLGAELGSQRVRVAGFGAQAAPYRVGLDVLRCQGALEGDFQLKVRWTLQGPRGKVLAERVSVFKEKVQGGTYDALVAAHGKALGDLAAEIATELKKP